MLAGRCIGEIRPDGRRYDVGLEPKAMGCGDELHRRNYENFARQTRSVASSAGSAAVQAAGAGSQLFFALPNSRLQETEADRMGLELAARAGYNPDAAVTLWQKMTSMNKGAPPQFLSTHPASENRIKDLQALAPKVRPLYEAAKAKQS